MANLVVRNIDEQIVRALKRRAGMHGISAEAEHRRILTSVLTKPQRKNFVEVIKDMPDAGEDHDFSRVQNEPETDVFT